MVVKLVVPIVSTPADVTVVVVELAWAEVVLVAEFEVE